MFEEAIEQALEIKERNKAWLAEKTGIAPSQISIYFDTGKRMGRENVEKMFEVLGIELKLPKS